MKERRVGFHAPRSEKEKIKKEILKQGIIEKAPQERAIREKKGQNITELTILIRKLHSS